MAKAANLTVSKLTGRSLQYFQYDFLSCWRNWAEKARSRTGNEKIMDEIRGSSVKVDLDRNAEKAQFAPGSRFGTRAASARRARSAADATNDTPGRRIC